MNRLWVVAVLALASADASAGCPECVCSATLMKIRTPDEPRDVALNARIVTGGVPDPAHKERYVLRKVGGDPVQVTSERLRVNDWGTLVLTPTAPLAATTEYELMFIDKDASKRVEAFVTSSGIDIVPPTWAGDLTATYEAADGCSIECDDRRGPRVEITAPVPEDDRSGADLYAVWVTSGAAIDYGKPAAGYVRTGLYPDSNIFQLGSATSRQLTIVLGGVGPCHQQYIALPRGAKQVRIGMKAIDRAGNASEPREVQVRLAVKH